MDNTEDWTIPTVDPCYEFHEALRKRLELRYGPEDPGALAKGDQINAALRRSAERHGRTSPIDPWLEEEACGGLPYDGDGWEED